jgi:hypothetical protein
MDGLLHVSDMSWVRNVAHLSEVVTQEAASGMRPARRTLRGKKLLG